MVNALGIIQPSNSHFWVDGMEDHRTSGAFSCMGRYRTIDFPISNLSNSGIEQIQVYIKRKPNTLVQHIGTGRQYNINSKTGKIQLLIGLSGNNHDLYNTDIINYLDNIDDYEMMKQEYVIITPSYMIFKQDYRSLLEKHIESGADISLLYHSVDNAKEAFFNCNTLVFNRQKGLEKIEKNRATAKNQNIFMETYVLSRKLFIELVKKAYATSSLYNFINIVDDSAADLDIRCIPHKGYFTAITDFKSYYDANLNLINSGHAKDLFTKDWQFYTRTNNSCPTRYYKGSKVSSSVISNGCKIMGTIINSVIGRECTIEEGAVIENSVILSSTYVGAGVHVKNHVVDKHVSITKVKDIIAEDGCIGYIRRNDKV